MRSATVRGAGEGEGEGGGDGIREFSPSHGVTASTTAYVLATTLARRGYARTGKGVVG